MGKVRIIDANTFADAWNKESQIGITMRAIIAEQPTIDPENLPVVIQLREELARVTAERDAAVSFIPKTCATCKYGKSPCDWCKTDPDGDLNWEWNGKRKEE